MSQPKPPDSLVMSVWRGNDSTLLNIMLSFYPVYTPKVIVDVTMNRGRFWKNTEYQVVGMDINEGYTPSIIGNNMAMPIKSGSVDVIVYDPPHMVDMASVHVADTQDQARYCRDYGLGGVTRGTDSISYMFKPFLAEAKRVLIPNGIILAKLADHIHNHKFQWLTLKFVAASIKVGMTPCDCIVKIRDNAMISGKWQVQRHAKRVHSTWIVVRNGNRCEP